MKITSAAFTEGGDIPKRHTCDGPDVSPPLRFASVPAETKALALVCDDPDAPGGTWVHWVLFNIPPEVGDVPEDQPKGPYALKNAPQGTNDFGRLGYGGPCPPPGKPHRYFFRLYALKEPVALAAGASKSQLEQALAGMVLAEAALMGRYQRSR